MTKQEELSPLATNLARIVEQKLDVAIWMDHTKVYDSEHKPDFLRPTISYQVRLRRGDFLRPTMEVVGRSEESISDALDRALRELDLAGQIGARLEPAAHGDDNYYYSQDDDRIPF